MKVDRAKAVRREFGGEIHYFCSQHCLDAYEMEPDRLASQTVGIPG